LFAADIAVERAPNVSSAEPGAQQAQYDSLFNVEESDEDLDEMLMEDGEGGHRDGQRAGGTRKRSGKSRTRHSSGASGGEAFLQQGSTPHVPVNFTARHSRILTETLTHTHLPGLSSVDQMHLLAIADTLCHFSSDVMDKLAQANASLQPVLVSTLGRRGCGWVPVCLTREYIGDTAAAGYATASMGVETVDECGLRFLMAVKQHEYLCLCLPLKQRQALKAKGIASSHVIWAFHSDTEV